MSEFTKGPWIADIPDDRILGQDNEVIADMNVCGTSIKEDAANIWLIAAAPDIYEALKDAIAICKLSFGKDYRSAAADIPMRLQEAEKALAKAKGETK